MTRTKLGCYRTDGQRGSVSPRIVGTPDCCSTAKYVPWVTSCYGSATRFRGTRSRYSSSRPSPDSPGGYTPGHWNSLVFGMTADRNSEGSTREAKSEARRSSV